MKEIRHCVPSGTVLLGMKHIQERCAKEPSPMAQKEESYDNLQRISSMQINKFVWRVNNNEK